MEIIKVLDILAAVITVLTLNLIPKSYKWWLGYGLGTILFTIVMVTKSLLGMAVMGVVLFITAVKNYYQGKLKEYKFNPYNDECVSRR